jgi:hypothetical protein
MNCLIFCPAFLESVRDRLKPGGSCRVAEGTTDPQAANRPPNRVNSNSASPTRWDCDSLPQTERRSQRMALAIRRDRTATSLRMWARRTPNPHAASRAYAIAHGLEGMPGAGSQGCRNP